MDARTCVPTSWGAAGDRNQYFVRLPRWEARRTIVDGMLSSDTYGGGETEIAQTFGNVARSWEAWNLPTAKIPTSGSRHLTSQPGKSPSIQLSKRLSPPKKKICQSYILPVYTLTFFPTPKHSNDRTLQTTNGSKLVSSNLLHDQSKLYKTKSPNPIQYPSPFGLHNNNLDSHSVNRHLCRAATAVRRYDVTALKEEMKVVIELLEPQHTRIVCESKKFGEFIDLQSKRWGIWDRIVMLENDTAEYKQAVAEANDTRDPRNLIRSQMQNLHWIRSIDFAKALVVLKEYAEAFHRDIPYESRKQIARWIRFEYQGHYDIMEREVAIRKL
ncbi:hypothetical protein EAF04_007449 [Stromatinia cepivora]|nr:hypothetical protein EAF04_007449 [Stromatinia cepivora]